MNTLFLKAPQLTAEIMRAHYCEHDLDKILPLFHETLTWIGAGEDQICYDCETIKDFFLRTYAEKAVPDCIITDEDYRLVSWDEHSCLVAGTLLDRHQARNRLCHPRPSTRDLLL